LLLAAGSASKTNTNARVKRLGVDTKNELLAPNNTHDAGWYENSAKPGEAGAMLIDGHVGFTKDGIFAHLKDLRKGDEISIERGDSQKFTYKVVDSQAYAADKLDMSKALVSAEPGKPGLNLITCTGKLTSNKTSYTDRLLVRAVQE
jgi:LPXTG-site transpeptidase (sortase) family protein